MAARITSPGDIIDAYCTSCRTVMNHTIVSMVQARPARVQCNTCGGVHNYRKEKASGPTPSRSPKPPPATRQTRKDPGNATHQEWAAMHLDQDASAAIAYDMQARYKVGNLVKHPKFGLGVVKTLIGVNKVEILFEEGLKLLRCS
jgi:hypothetical protein